MNGGVGLWHNHIALDHSQARSLLFKGFALFDDAVGLNPAFQSRAGAVYGCQGITRISGQQGGVSVLQSRAHLANIHIGHYVAQRLASQNFAHLTAYRRQRHTVLLYPAGLLFRRAPRGPLSGCHAQNRRFHLVQIFAIGLARNIRRFLRQPVIIRKALVCICLGITGKAALPHHNVVIKVVVEPVGIT